MHLPNENMSELIACPSLEAKEIEASPPPTPAINLSTRKHNEPDTDCVW
jgi:hypothetical protein